VFSWWLWKNWVLNSTWHAVRQDDDDLLFVLAETKNRDKIDATSSAGSARNVAKRASPLGERGKRATHIQQHMLLKRANTVMRDGMLEAVKDKTLLSHLKNKDYVQTEIDNFNDFPATHAARIIPLTCVQLILDIFTVMAKLGG
jgi:hypothetical protein